MAKTAEQVEAKAAKIAMKAELAARREAFLAQEQVMRFDYFDRLVLKKGKLNGHDLVGAQVVLGAPTQGRITATRIATIGVFALAARKGGGSTLTVLGETGWMETTDVKPKDMEKAAKFAAHVQQVITWQSSRAAA